MTNYLYDENHRQEMHRQADHERLARLAERQSRPHIYRPLLVQIGRQMSHLGERIQQANQEQPVRWREVYNPK